MYILLSIVFDLYIGPRMKNMACIVQASLGSRDHELKTNSICTRPLKGLLLLGLTALVIKGKVKRVS